MRSMTASLVLLIAAAGSLVAPPLRAETPAGAQIHTEEVEYSAGDTPLNGFLAWDAGREGTRPGVLIVHEWWGMNDYARSRARQLAELGYTALALDLYGNGKLAEHPEDAMKFSAAVMADLPEAEARFEAARALLAAQPTVDPTKIGVIGYCFGGGVALHMARIGADLQAVVTFHGALGSMHTPEPGTVKPRILVATGGADPFAPPEQVEALEAEMDAAGADYRVVVYEGAKHSFTNPGSTAVGKQFNLPLEYNEAADRQSWQAMQELFAEAFADPPPGEDAAGE